MADQKPTSNYYDNLGGINLKSSTYEMSTAQFLNLRNMDFDKPKALSKRPGSSHAITTGASGPISSVFEFVKLTGQSYVIAGSDTAMFYMAGTGLTLLSPTWNNSQPTDMLTFVNKAWMANGQNFQWWDGSATAAAAGLPCPRTSAELQAQSGANGATWYKVGGATAYPDHNGSASFIARGVYVAYSFIRSDGYYGPQDFLHSARNLVSRRFGTPAPNVEYFVNMTSFFGITTSNFAGLSALAIWVGVDSVGSNSPLEFIDGGYIQAGDLGYAINFNSGGNWFESETLKPTADLSKFYLFTTVPISNLFLGLDVNGITSYGTTFGFTAQSFNSFTGTATGAQAFSGLPFCWFDTNTPKYIEINQNIMFMAGFSNAPSTVWFSGVGEPENIDPENNFEVRTNDGDRIYATHVYQNNMIVMKEMSFDKIIGDSADNFQLVEVSNQFGCLSNKTVIEYNQKLVWLDRKGILEFTGANYAIVSGPVEPIFRRMNIPAAKEKACAVHHVFRNQIWFGIPIDGSSVNNITVVYDYLVGGWTFFDGFNPSSFGFVKADMAKQTVWRGDYSGFLNYFSESLYGDNGVGITCLGFTRFENAVGENETTIWRRLFLDMSVATGITGVVNCQIFSNYDQSTIQATFAMYQDQFQSRAEYGVVAKSVAVQFAQNSASLPLTISGYGLAKRELRNV